MSRPLPEQLPLHRLVAVGKLVRDTRNNAIRTVFDPASDGVWGIGCLIFDRVRRAISVAAAGEYAEWLEIVEPHLHFVFSVDGCPLRFYRGCADRRAPGGQVMVRVPEATVAQLVLPGFEGLPMYRLMYESDATSLTFSRLFLVELDSRANVVYAWEVPLVEGETALPIDAGDKAVQLPPVDLALINRLVEEEEQDLRRAEEL